MFYVLAMYQDNSLEEITIAGRDLIIFPPMGWTGSTGSVPADLWVFTNL